MRNPQGRSGFETWSPQRDITDLMEWEQIFGKDFKAVLGFVYELNPAPLYPEAGMFQFRDRWYWILGVELTEYRNHMRRRSPRWETVSLPAAEFQSLARPLESWL